jgi:hypothetical protein
MIRGGRACQQVRYTSTILFAKRPAAIRMRCVSPLDLSLHPNSTSCVSVVESDERKDARFEVRSDSIPVTFSPYLSLLPLVYSAIPITVQGLHPSILLRLPMRLRSSCFTYHVLYCYIHLIVRITQEIFKRYCSQIEGRALRPLRPFVFLTREQRIPAPKERWLIAEARSGRTYSQNGLDLQHK